MHGFRVFIKTYDVLVCPKALVDWKSIKVKFIEYFSFSEYISLSWPVNLENLVVVFRAIIISINKSKDLMDWHSLLQYRGEEERRVPLYQREGKNKNKGAEKGERTVRGVWHSDRSALRSVTIISAERSAYWYNSDLISNKQIPPFLYYLAVTPNLINGYLMCGFNIIEKHRNLLVLKTSHRYQTFLLLQPSEMASLSYSRWQNRKGRPNWSTKPNVMWRSKSVKSI